MSYFKEEDLNLLLQIFLEFFKKLYFFVEKKIVLKNDIYSRIVDEKIKIFFESFKKAWS